MNWNLSFFPLCVVHVLHATKFNLKFPKSPDFGGNSEIGRCDRRKKKKDKKVKNKKGKMYCSKLEMRMNGGVKSELFRG